MGLAVRIVTATIVVPALERRANVASDPDHYADLAASLVDRGELGFSPPGASPTTLRGPAYPSYLAAGMLASRSERWLALWSSIPGLVAAGAIFLVLFRSHGAKAAWTGGLLCATHPLSCFVSARLLPDELYGALLLLGLLAAEALRARGRPLHAVLAGVLLALAALTRSTALLVIAGVIAAESIRVRRRIRSAAVVALTAALLIGPWMLRTSALAGRPELVESLAGYNFWLGEAADRYGFAAGFGEARERAHALMTAEAGTEETRSGSFLYVTLGPREADAFDGKLRTAAVRTIAAAPLHYGKRLVAGVFWLWVRGETATRTIQYVLVALPLAILGLAGLWRAGSRLMMFTAAAHIILYAAICPMARYGVQLYPLLCYGVGALFAARKTKFF